MTLFSRPPDDTDDRGLIDLYERVTGTRRTIEKWRWEWRNHPEGSGSQWIIVDDRTGEIVGHHGLLPMRLSYRGSPIMLGKTENTMIHPRLAGRKVYFPFEKRFIENELGDRFDLLMTTAASGAPARVRSKLGYVVLGHWTVHAWFGSRASTASFFHRHASRVLKRHGATLLSHSLSTAVSLPFTGASRLRGWLSPPTFTVEEADMGRHADDLDHLFEANRQSAFIAPWRSSSFLRWRVRDNPYLHQRVLLVRDGRRVVGYGVVKLPPSGGPARVSIEDVLAVEDDPGLLGHVLLALAHVIRREGHPLIVMRHLGGNELLERAALRAGFLPLSVIGHRRTRGSAIMIRRQSDAVDPVFVSDPTHWYLTAVFDEGVG